MTSAWRWEGEEREFAECPSLGGVWSGWWGCLPPPSWVSLSLANTLLFFSYWCVSSSDVTTQCVLYLMDTCSGFSLLFQKKITHLAKLNFSTEDQWPAHHLRVSGVILWAHVQGLCCHPVSPTPLFFTSIPGSLVIHSTLKSRLLLVAIWHRTRQLCGSAPALYTSIQS